MAHCVLYPDKGKQTFKKTQEVFGRQKARDLYYKIIGEDFNKYYGDKVEYDETGVATFESLLNIPQVVEFLGENEVMNYFQKQQPHMENTIENTAFLTREAQKFNDSNNNFVTIVNTDEDFNLTLEVMPKNEVTNNMVKRQQAIQRANEKAAQMLAKAGITIEMLDNVQTSVGKIGVTEFTKSQNSLNEYGITIKVANTKDGHGAISEETAHAIIGANRDNPLIKRSIEALKNEELAREILGDKYNEYYEIYEGDSEYIAEEAVGHILQEAILQGMENIDEATSGKSIFKRMVNSIMTTFKGIDYKTYKQEIDTIFNDLSEIAQKFIKDEPILTKEKIQRAQRMAKFNAVLSKLKIQKKVLKDIYGMAYKNASLRITTTDEKIDVDSEANRFAKRLFAAVKTNGEETMAAIAEVIDIATEHIDTLKNEIENIDDLDTKHKFIALRDTLRELMVYARMIKSLQDITVTSFLSDESIRNQEFMLDDSEYSLEEYEVTKRDTPFDTSNMTQKEIEDLIVKESKKWGLSEDQSHYEHEDGSKGLRVTKTIEADVHAGNPFDPNNGYVTPSTNIGTGVDELVRDFLADRITKDSDGNYKIGDKYVDEVYPNASRKQLNAFLDQVEGFRKKLSDKGIKIITRDVVASGTIETVDGAGVTHRVRVVGTVDLLGYNEKTGKWYLFDMKTHRGAITQEKENKWRRQLTLYKKFLEEQYGIEIEETGILPIKVQYPAPKGEGGTAEYTVSKEKKAAEYNGKENNQLLKDGEEYRDAKPDLEQERIYDTIDINIKYSKLSGDPKNGLNGGIELIHNSLSNLNYLYQDLQSIFNENAFPEFVKFLEPFIGDVIEIPDPKDPNILKKVSLDKILTMETPDVTLVQQWLTSIADNPNIIVQIFGQVVTTQKRLKNIDAINAYNEIILLGKKFERLGIRDYEFMFESNKNFYVNPLYDRSSYEKSKKEFKASLDIKYGIAPKFNSTESIAKRKAMDDWEEANTIEIIDEDGENRIIPNPEIYKSKYESFTNNQKKFYDEWMALKEQFDDYLPNGSTELHNSIKINKSGYERVKSALSQGDYKTFITGLKASIKKNFGDTQNYDKGIRDFNGQEAYTLPVYYVSHLSAEDAKDVSTDVIGTLIAYSEMALNNHYLFEVMNALEVGKYLILNQDNLIRQTRGEKALNEGFMYLGKAMTNPIYKDTKTSALADTLNQFMESKVYGRVLEDAGEIMGMDKNKVASALLKLGSAIQLGFNALAQITNTITGANMTNIEAFTGEFFTAKTLAKADAIFAKELPSYVGDIGQRVQKSKLALFIDYFDVKQQLSGKLKNANFTNKTILTRLFGPNLQFLGQTAGDFWLYSRVAIAMALETKVFIKNQDGSITETNLWDATEVKPVDRDILEAGNKLIFKDNCFNEDNQKWSNKDTIDFINRVTYVNQHLFGIYNDEDSLLIRRKIWGRFLMQYRDWMPTQYRLRWGKKAANLRKGGTVEGYYLTTDRFIKNCWKELRHGEKSIIQVWKDLSIEDKRNIFRFRNEMLQYLCVYGLAKFIGGAGKDKSYIRRLISYLCVREQTELGALALTNKTPNQLLTIAKSPFAATNIMDDISGMASLLWPFNYFDEIQSGDYKGHSTAYRAFVQSPLTLWYRTLKRTASPERAERFFDN